MPFSIFRERTYHGDFIEGCFGVLGPLGNYPQGTFLGHISVENNPKIDHCEVLFWQTYTRMTHLGTLTKIAAILSMRALHQDAVRARSCPRTECFRIHFSATYEISEKINVQRIVANRDKITV